MSRRLPPLNSLRVFEAAARQLSFTKAAQELFVTQAAVSHQIKALEAFLGLKLFQRKNRSLLLTDEGQSYFLDIKDIFESIAEATDRVLQKNDKGTLTICLPPSFAIQWLVPRLADFNQKHPDIDVRIKAVDLDEDSLTDDVDVAIYYGAGNWPELRADKLYQEFLVPLCSPKFLLNEQSADSGQLADRLAADRLAADSRQLADRSGLRSLSDLSQYTLLHDSSRQDWQQFVKQNGIEGVNVNHGPIFSHSAMVLQAAVHGQGIALGNNVLAQPELAAGRLVAPFDQVLVSSNAFYVVCADKQADSGKVATFRDWMLATATREQEALFDDDALLYE
jgi:LysR family glycine cleavage system transcriptional activator